MSLHCQSALKKYRYSTCKVFVGLHNLSGSDWSGKFVGITKKTWVDDYMTLDEDDQAIICFKGLGTALIPTQLTHGELAPQIKNWKLQIRPTYPQELRLEMFRSRKEKAYHHYLHPFFPIICV